MRQRLGQNFLINAGVADHIVSAAELSAQDTVLEIGPGKGVLTERIAPRAKTLIAVELDPVLASFLSSRFANSGNVRVLRADFLDYPVETLPAPFKAIANLPYYVSTAILEKLLPSPGWTLAVVMVQKEVGERIKAAHSTKEYGYFSIFCQYFARVSTVAAVHPGSFFPPPKVDSIVLKFENLRPPPPENGFFSFIKHAFQQRRKTVLNSLSSALDIPKPTVLTTLEASGIAPDLRPENLTFEDYLRLFKTMRPG